jgi:hypothetical protein
MPKRVAILQSNCVPWKGYFDIIHDVDEFVFHDDLQYRNCEELSEPFDGLRSDMEKDAATPENAAAEIARLSAGVFR